MSEDQILPEAVIKEKKLFCYASSDLLIEVAKSATI